MTDGKPSGGTVKADDGRTKKKDSRPGRQPDWTNGLRQLYDSVVEEPLPDQFTELLSRLDKKD
ncbi:hypothetical protein E3U23_01845 [Erythrobacter litoralis]|uniref:NepR family anti-sigma factor n=1 Tax=Erythrobacter litoralis TaxID=39960 RepID=UPI002434AE7F|nr:NepR family anti-sigma factor [Erythrobacter litoralis]MDG6077941.1 hypothetical protein [Erythrobacter litoralis]